MTDLGELTIDRVFRADRADVFHAYVTPERFVDFWGPEGTHVPLESVTIEPFAGGRFESTMVVDGTDRSFPLDAVFETVTEPELLVFRVRGTTMRSAIHLTDLGDGRTAVRLHQTEVPPQYLGPQAEAGLNSSLDRLAAHLAG
ncbi:SRPBCC family protein [Kitasatospora sp. NPDC004289]